MKELINIGLSVMKQILIVLVKLLYIYFLFFSGFFLVFFSFFGVFSDFLYFFVFFCVFLIIYSDESDGEGSTDEEVSSADECYEEDYFDNHIVSLSKEKQKCIQTKFKHVEDIKCFVREYSDDHSQLVQLVDSFNLNDIKQTGHTSMKWNSKDHFICFGKVD